MTDRHVGYMVVLENNTREDDAEAIVNALKMVKGVARVEPVVADVSSSMFAQMQERTKLAQELFDKGRELLSTT